MSLATLPPLRDVIRRLGLSARRSLGQNFILDLNLTAKIARAAGPLEGRTVLEVGPGPGGLTRALIAEGAARVVAIEKDARCLPALAEIAAACSGRLEVVAGDATEVDQRALAGEGALIVANLPYSVGTLLLVSWLTVEPWPPWYASMTLMFQREVADRLVADVGSREYGRLSVIAQWRTEPRILFGLPARAFTPVPRVDSALVRLVPRANPLPCSERSLAKVTAAAFGQRRKMLRASLKQIWPAPEPVLEAEAIDARLRAEDIDVAAFCRLALRLDSAS